MTLLGYRVSYKLSYRQQAKVQILKAQKVSTWALVTLNIFQKIRMSEKCRNNSDNPLTSRRTDGGNKQFYLLRYKRSKSHQCCLLLFLVFAFNPQVGKKSWNSFSFVKFRLYDLKYYLNCY